MSKALTRDVPGASSAFWTMHRKAERARLAFEAGLEAERIAAADLRVMERMLHETSAAGKIPSAVLWASVDERTAAHKAARSHAAELRKAWERADAQLLRETRRLGWDPSSDSSRDRETQRRRVRGVEIWSGATQKARAAQWRDLSATYLELSERPAILRGVGWTTPARRARLLRLVAVNLEAAAEALALLAWADPPETGSAE